MKVRVIARSISRPVRERLPFAARVLAVFNRACDLVTAAGAVVALVTPQAGDGPLNVVVEAEAGCFDGLKPGMAAQAERNHLRVRGNGPSSLLDVVLEGAAVWEPCPAWRALRAQRAVIEERLPRLRTLALRHTPAAGRDAIPPYGPAREAAAALRAGWKGDEVQVRAGAARLAGLGGGLTPAGDDFLVGVMLWAWLAHPQPVSVCRAIAEEAAPRTTTLSAAFLRAAARGECGAAWHRLLSALVAGTEDGLTTAVQDVLAYGATSGADALAGFLWISAPEVLLRT
ncbi:MAG: DUF2877 domain-containing protein [Anaerolineae bacterium]|nr:DUF2877 domain-containing protein [Anaerolineae bacterium]